MVFSYVSVADTIPVHRIVRVMHMLASLLRIPAMHVVMSVTIIFE